MSTQQKPVGPWEASEVSPFLGSSFAPYWTVRREKGRFGETMKHADGKAVRFPSKAAADSAIAKAGSAA